MGSLSTYRVKVDPRGVISELHCQRQPRYHEKAGCHRCCPPKSLKVLNPRVRLHPVGSETPRETPGQVAKAGIDSARRAAWVWVYSTCICLGTQAERATIIHAMLSSRLVQKAPKPKPNHANTLKSLLVSHPPTSHWPKQAAWPSPTSVRRGSDLCLRWENTLGFYLLSCSWVKESQKFMAEGGLHTSGHPLCPRRWPENRGQGKRSKQMSYSFVVLCIDKAWR